jgi:CubicO group peptidase (beta-lactamase class C family)
LLAFVTALTVAFAPSDGLPARPAKSVGMSAARLSAIDRVVNRGLRAGGYPGAAVVVGRRGFSVFEKGFGHLGWTAGSPSVDTDRTIYDLASLTKVVGTTTAAMILYDEGRLDLEAAVSRYIPGFGGGMKDEVTIRHLLTHRSGLPAGRDLWRLSSGREDAKNIVILTPLVCRPGDCFIYSDLGADMLGWVIERITGQGLDAFLNERVFGPLGMTDTQFRPADSLRARIAPTEVSPPRGYPIRGEVHDENAWVLGGVAGHAGLFSTAADLSIFAQMMLNRGEYNGVRIVSDSTVSLFTQRAAGSRALGWDTADGEGSSGVFLSDRAYGHTGFTGTSMWIDPDREMFVILLTNRVHAARARRPAKVISDVRADLSDAAAGAVVDADMVVDMPAFRSDKAVGWNRSPVRRSSAKARAKSARTTRAAPSTARGTKVKASSARTKVSSSKPKVSSAKPKVSTAKAKTSKAAASASKQKAGAASSKGSGR